MDTIANRFFLVGCARSGTTLLQSLLAANSDIMSFPESHFFEALAPDTRWRRFLRVASPEARLHLAAFYEDIGFDETCVLPSRFAFRVKTYAQSLARTLDNKALKNGNHRWLEKTPLHLRYTDLIERYVPDVQFVHIVREGCDVVASMYKATNEHPDKWGGARDIEACISRWKRDIEYTRHHMGKQNHHVVRYENLVSTPAASLKLLCSRLGIGYEPAMLKDYKKQVHTVVRSDEPWKSENTKAIQQTHENKFRTLFDDDQQRFIAEAVSDYDLRALSTL